MKDSVWPLVNDSFFSVRPDIELRVYGYHSTECDLSFAVTVTIARSHGRGAHGKSDWDPSTAFAYA